MMLQEQPTLFTLTNVLVALFGFLVMVATALLVIMSKRKDSLADTNERLLKARATEVTDCEKKCDRCQEELEDVTAEYRAVTAIQLRDLFSYWQIRESELARIQTLESELRVCKIRLGDMK
jgi:hypothetical protein